MVDSESDWNFPQGYVMSVRTNKLKFHVHFNIWLACGTTVLSKLTSPIE